ncbi:hypothetical protein SUDANB105_01378 [Streptomyces sp. enrichment culture]|uniref:SMI1/KNR4 family protein n=1 Tax=Streptomyces sp. enrichment culture TaxID=1795815 RepID=UPI003F549676
MPSIHDFATWEPVLRLLSPGSASDAATAGGRVAGRIDRHGWSLPLRRPRPRPGQAAQVEDMQAEFDAVRRVQRALAGSGADTVSFSAEFLPDARAVVHLLGSSPAVEPGVGSAHPGSLVLVEDAVPAPWRRLPEPVPGALPAPTADPELLERTLRERLPDAIGATEAEIAQAEARLGVALPEELKALYRVTRAKWEDWADDHGAPARHAEAVGCELFALDELYISDVASRPCPWRFAATEAAVTPPDAAVQRLAGSPGWIVFGDNGGGDRIAVDLTPGPRGRLGQVVMIGHEDNLGAELLAHSVTDMILEREAEEPHDGREGEGREDEPSPVAHVNIRSLPSVAAAAHPALEVLCVGVWEGEPVSLAPVVGLPRLRTLTAYPGTLADPLEIARLTGLEYLELGPGEWRVLLDADAVPRGLSAVGIVAHGNPDPLPIVGLANEILSLWDRPLISRTVLEGRLGQVA